MSSKQGAKAKPLKHAKVDKKEYDEDLIGTTNFRRQLPYLRIGRLKTLDPRRASLLGLILKSRVENLHRAHQTLSDSSNNVRIEDCYISTGDDLIAVKSGWFEYGISFAHPSSNISIRHITGETKLGAGIAFGSEMSGGVSEVWAEDIHLFNSKHGIRIKTSPGRGGYIQNIYISDVIMKNVDIAIGIQGQYGEHPDEKSIMTQLKPKFQQFRIT